MMYEQIEIINNYVPIFSAWGFYSRFFFSRFSPLFMQSQQYMLQEARA